MRNKIEKILLLSALLVWFSIGTFAKNHVIFLKPGSYNFQEFRVKVVLADTGSYQFDHCRFFILGKDSGLVGQNLHLLELNHCYFFGHHAGTGIGIRNSNLVVNQCQIENLTWAISICQNDPKPTFIQKSRLFNNQTGLNYRYESKASGIIYPLNILQNDFSGNQTAILPTDIHECEEGIPNPTVVVFPTRMALDSASGTTTGKSPLEDGLENNPGQNIPNPGSSEILIPYQLNGTCKTSTLEIIQMATGRTIQQISLSKEATELKLDINQYPAGVYAYSLQVDGSPVQTRKLVVVK